jgi:hypothetical protein
MIGKIVLKQTVVVLTDIPCSAIHVTEIVVSDACVRAVSRATQLTRASRLVAAAVPARR